MKKSVLLFTLVTVLVFASAANDLLLAEQTGTTRPILGQPPEPFAGPLDSQELSGEEQQLSTPVIPTNGYDFFVYLPAVFKALPCASTWQAEEIASLAINHPGQGRPNMNCHPILDQVAHERALDMGVRNYFSHVNPDGHGPNYLVRQAGYKLPSWWGTDPELNYIESIAGGYQTAGAAWNAWLGSPAHRRHVLGEIDFYAGRGPASAALRRPAIVTAAARRVLLARDTPVEYLFPSVSHSDLETTNQLSQKLEAAD
jgi:hypothetical protein